MYKYEYMRPVTVQSVSAGGIIDDSGRFLRMAGSIQVQTGDTVFTDGNIIYGHSPKREKASIPTRKAGIPYHGGDGSYSEGERQSYNFGAFKKTGTIYPPDFAMNSSLKKLNKLTTCMYTTPKGVYGYTEGSPRTDLCDYLDMKVTDNAVFTAQYTPNDAPFGGKTSEYAEGEMRRYLQTFIANFYFYHDDENSTDANPVFDLRWHPTGGKVYTNPIISVKRNGEVIASITLSDYQFALDKLKDVYLQYDEYGDDRVAKRYHLTGKVDGQSVPGLDLWCSYMITEVLNFHFTDDAGNWEMILFNGVEGVVLPHTIDNEMNLYTNEYEDVYSDYHISCPVIYYVMRIKSNGQPEKLHERVCVKSFEDNAVTKSSWVNAKAVRVTEVNIKNEPYFGINFGDCAMTTNLKSSGQITDKDGNAVTNGNLLFGFRKFTMSNPDAAQPIGAINSFITEDLRGGNSTTSTTSNQHLGYWTSNNNYGLAEYFYSPPIITFSKGCSAYFGRLSLYKCADGQYIISLKNQGIFKSGNTQVPIVQYSSNMNLDIVKNLRSINNIKSISDLIADVTASNNE